MAGTLRVRTRCLTCIDRAWGARGASCIARWPRCSPEKTTVRKDGSTRSASKTILRYANLARLMHKIVRLESGEFLFRFDGAVSIARETRRYGAALARFLPALVACRDWRMHAVVQSRFGSWKLGLDLS